MMRMNHLMFALLGSACLVGTVRADDDPAKTADVTAKVAAEVKDNKLQVTVNPDLLGDPASGENKELRVEYTIGDEAHKKVAGENRTLRIIAPEGRKLVIKKAVWGVLADAADPADPADVTAKVAAAVKDNALSVNVDNDTLGVDPAPTLAKQLRVRYTAGGGEKTAMADENGTLQIAKPEGGAKLVVVEALYGPAMPYVDVTQKVSEMVKEGKLSVTADNDTFGDPSSGSAKQLKIEYTVAGKPHTATAGEGEALQLPTADDGQGALVITKATYGVLPSN